MMNDIEIHANELIRRRQWCGAAELFSDLLGSSLHKDTPKELIAGYLIGRSECLFELGRHEAVIADCQQAIKLLANSEQSNNNGSKAWKRLVHALFSLRRFAEAEVATREWLIISGGATNQPEAAKMLDRLRVVFEMTNGQPNPHLITTPSLEDDLLTLESSLETWTGIGAPQQRKHPVQLIGESMEPEAFNEAPESGEVETETGLACTYCCLTFSDRAELRAHCQSEAHQRVIMSDEGRDWQWRPPPRGLTSDAYAVCDAWTDNAACRYGNQCVDAHGSQELAEWKERFEYRRMKLQRACEKELFGKAYTEQLLERWVSAPSPDKVLRERLENVEDSCSAELITTVAAKRSNKEWIFTLVTDRILRHVALLQDSTRNHFFIKHVSSHDVTRNVLVEWTPTNDQEWAVPPIPDCLCLEHKVTVTFSTDIYGTFRQSLVVDLGRDPVLVKHLCVDVVPVDSADKMKQIVKEMTGAGLERWDQRNSQITQYVAPVVPGALPVQPQAEGERERELLSAYPSPRADVFALTQSTVQERRLTRNNYRARMHELLSVEEMARYEQVARYNMTTKLRLADCYLLAPSGMATSTAKYSHSGELFALMTLGKDVSEDTSSGRLILNNCTTVLLAASRGKGGKKGDEGADAGKRVVYEALIEDKGKNMIYLRLSSATVRALSMKADTDFSAEVQFQLNRVPYCEWHYAIDKIGDFRVIFPETYVEPSIPWTPQRQWSDTLDSRLNLKQKEAVVAITTPVGIPLPPILIIGPFGTGKTFTLAQAIKQLLRQSDTKVLVCTHSNSAADLYIKDYLHPYVEAGNEHARPLRIYYHRRWVATVNQTVQKYCLVELVDGVRTFRVPTVADIARHRIIVVTLSISMYLATLGLDKGHFTHILLDEAAQAMECEAIMPLALASDTTRIVLAGDHMQLSPELFSQFAKERNLHVSLLERLYDHYPHTFPCKVLLCENYRAHEAIIKFTSELFYDQKLISSGNQPRHDKFYPLTFFTTRGEDVQDINSTAFYNNSEVYEVVERVCELRKKWPAAWGKIDDQSIGIMTPYADQVFRIRSELRKRRMGGISVERVLNVQGKQFRAIFLSTVRTRRTCSSVTKAAPGGDQMDYGFLSNSKLLNTAITRAQSLVAVVGDPVALCSIGRCRKVWERFIEICNENKSLFGITWPSLRSQLDGVELKKAFVLNPLAPEFVPRSYQSESYIRLPSILGPVPPQAPPFTPQLVFPRYPLYYYPQQPPPPAHFSVRPPAPMLFPAVPPPPLNPWGVNYPLASPPNVGLRPNALKGKPEPVGDPQRPRFSTNPSPVGDSYVPGGLISPANFVRGPGFIGSSVVRERGDKEQIQFLQNVHFPEHRAEASGLLPAAMSLQDMLDSRTKQLEWYNHLMETQGPQIGNKFMELLMLGSRKSVPLHHLDMHHPDMVRADHHLDMVRTEHHPDMMRADHHHLDMVRNDHHLEMVRTEHHLELMRSEHHPDMVRPGEDIFSDKSASMFHPIHTHHAPMNPMLGDVKPTLLRDIEETMMQQGHMDTRDAWTIAQREHQQQQMLQQSVPLYRRQPAEPPVPGTSGAFAGYARAALTNGLPAQQMFPIQMPPRGQQFHPQHQNVNASNQFLKQQLMSQHVNAEFGSGPSHETTYASVLRAQPQKNELGEEEEEGEEKGDPFAVLRALGARRNTHGNTGLYQYFS